MSDVYSKLKFRPLNKEDYKTLCKWWKWWRWTPVEQESLPNNGTGGFMVYNDNVEICAGFIYTTNSNLCHIEWLVSNYEVKDKKIRTEAVELLINTLIALGKNLGYKIAFTYLLNKNLENKFKNCGFVHSSNPVELIKKI
tara:strand:+ start:2313 stop:2732 length:420 start_codon:yes stop_codon:yes gene_type:complete